MAITRPANSTLQPLNRKGISIDRRAGQYVCTVGYRLNDEASRVRAFQYLGNDPEEAILKHARIVSDWRKTKQQWPSIEPTLRDNLPSPLKDCITSKPFWIRPEWKQQAKVEFAAGITTALEQLKEALAAESVNGLPPELRARVLNVTAPSANEVLGISPDAKRLTIREPVNAYLEHKGQKIGLKIPGLKRGGGVNANTYNGIKRELEYAIKFMDETEELSVLSHERLEKFRDDVYRAANKPRTAWNRVKVFKGMLDWAHRNRQIDYRNVDTIDEIFGLARPETTVKMSYTPDVIAKLIAIRQSAAAVVKKGGEPVWPFVLLALNVGAYPVDIAHFTHENIRKDSDGTIYLWWQRRKTSHQNANLFTRHDLWPETWRAISPLFAPDDLSANPERRLFLNSDGRPMYSTAKDKANTDVLGLRYKRTCNKAVDEDGNLAPVELPFMQLRKIGLNAIKKFSGGSDDVVRKFAGQRVPGILKAYLDDEFTDVSEALQKWQKQLAADGVL